MCLESVCQGDIETQTGQVSWLSELQALAYRHVILSSVPGTHVVEEET